MHKTSFILKLFIIIFIFILNLIRKNNIIISTV